MIDTYEQNLYDYQIDYNYKFLADSYREIRDGGYCFVYKEETLKELVTILDNKQIKYKLESHEEEGYWKIISRGEKRNGRKKRKTQEK